MSRYELFCSLSYVLHVLISQIVHFALLHMGPWAYGWTVVRIDIYLHICFFKCEHFCNLIYVLHVQVSKILHFALMHLGPWASGWTDVEIYISLQSCTLRYVLHVYVRFCTLQFCTWGHEQWICPNLGPLRCFPSLLWGSRTDSESRGPW